MRKNQKHNDQEHGTEILKAVAQAWHGHSSSSKSSTTTTSEFDAHRLYFKGRPSRFKLEAMNMATKKEQCGTGASWDFGKSLWDSYEIVAVSKKLETGLVLDNPYSSASNEQGHGVKKRKESKNSLRNLFSLVSSRRYSQADLPSEGD